MLYDGKPVAVGEPKARTDRFWDALALTGAPRPTVLVGTRGAWLISEVHDEIVVETVVSPSSDILRWQWLDEAEGQPGPERSVTIRDSSTESRTLDGGRLLLLGRSVVLDLDTLQFTHLRLSYATTVQELGGFNAGDEEVKILSPGRTQMVLVGSRTVDRMYEYALVMFEIATGRVYAVPFDSNALHFRSVWDATPEWIDHYFEWKRDPRGVERIEVVQPISALPWQGRLRHRHGGEVEYKLHPAGPGLTEPLRKLIETEFAAQRVAPTYGDPNDPDATSYDASGRRFRLWYNPELRNLSVFAERIDGFTTEGTPALIEEIGIRFNAILATGIHQQEFSSFLNHR
ncbi:MAG: hypothetical protein GY946_16630 [bacterium]|nr:hypothetical protein [bacterium]